MYLRAFTHRRYGKWPLCLREEARKRCNGPRWCCLPTDDHVVRLGPLKVMFVSRRKLVRWLHLRRIFSSAYNSVWKAIYAIFSPIMVCGLGPDITKSIGIIQKNIFKTFVRIQHFLNFQNLWADYFFGGDLSLSQKMFFLFFPLPFLPGWLENKVTFLDLLGLLWHHRSTTVGKWWWPASYRSCVGYEVSCCIV